MLLIMSICMSLCTPHMHLHVHASVCLSAVLSVRLSVLHTRAQAHACMYAIRTQAFAFTGLSEASKATGYF